MVEELSTRTYYWLCLLVQEYRAEVVGQRREKLSVTYSELIIVVYLYYSCGALFILPAIQKCLNYWVATQCVVAIAN